ncbi:MAG TPA: hypothetical protein VHZ29_01825 [Rhizomicrobium sp.]|jgi:hypothetical protein|nr:hypothetical protein [Rhizomicrobium sp.]
METPTIRGSKVITFADRLSRRMWKGWLVVGIVWLVLAALATVESGTKGGPSASDIVVMWTVVPAFLVVMLLIHLGWLYFTKNIYVEVEMDAQAFTFRDETGVALVVPWRLISSAKEFSRDFLLKSDNIHFTVYKKLFSDAALAAIRRLLTEKLGASAKLLPV